MVRIAPGFGSFSVGGPSSSVKSGGPYLVHGVCFSSHLLLEGTDRIDNFGP
jgi:hypothetical protein